MDDVWEQAVLHKQLTATLGLRLAFDVEIDIDPAGEEVLRVPIALAVAQQDQGSRMRHGSLGVRLGVEVGEGGEIRRRFAPRAAPGPLAPDALSEAQL